MFLNKIKNIFFVFRTQNLCPQQMLRARANGEKLVSATMCPSLPGALGLPNDNILQSAGHLHVLWCNTNGNVRREGTGWDRMGRPGTGQDAKGNGRDGGS